MSTTATVSEMAVKPEAVTFGLQATTVTTGKDNNGNDIQKTELKAISREKELESSRKNNQLLFEQTFSYDLANNLDGLLNITKGDADEAVAIFNAGLKIRLNSRLKALLEDVDEDGNPTFQPVEGTYDLRDILAEPAQRRNLSPSDKAVRVLIGLGMDKDTAMAMVQQAMAKKEAESLEAATAAA